MEQVIRLFGLTSLSSRRAEAENLARTLLNNFSLLDNLHSPSSQDLRRIGLAVLRLLDKTGTGRWDESDDPLGPRQRQASGAKIRKRRKRKNRSQRRGVWDIRRKFPVPAPQYGPPWEGLNLTALKNDLEDITSTLSYLQLRRPSYDDRDFYMRFYAETSHFQTSLRRALNMVLVAEGARWAGLEGSQGTTPGRQPR